LLRTIFTWRYGSNIILSPTQRKAEEAVALNNQYADERRSASDIGPDIAVLVPAAQRRGRSARSPKWKAQDLIRREVLGFLPSEVVRALTPGDLGFMQELQSRIYRLDEYGERHAEIDHRATGTLWNGITSKLSERPSLFRLVSPELERLRAYQEFEEQIHEGCWPEYLAGVSAMQLKSADVMILKIIALATTGLGIGEIEEERKLAVAREPLDDARDVFEDMLTWNYNLWVVDPPWARQRRLRYGIGSSSTGHVSNGTG
jgi:hypothetical protein